MKKRKILNLVLAGTLALGGWIGFAPASSAQTQATKAQTSPNKAFVTGQSLVRFGQKFLGTKYQLGAEYETSRKFDCSSFTQYVFKKHGIRLARGARGQYQNGRPISRSQLRVGDLVFFSTTATLKYSRNSIKRIGHVGIYAGNNRVLHTYGAGGVKYSDMSRGWWDKHYVAAVRVIR